MLISWSAFCTFCATVSNGSKIGFIENESSIVAWINYKGTVVQSELEKSNTAALATFNTTMRLFGNVPEADAVRITTCRFGRKLTSRFISFATALPDSLDNTDENAVDYGDVVYSMRDAANAVTLVPAAAVRTLIDFQPPFDYEISAGTIFLPSALAGADENLWELHVRAAPDIPAAYGGSIPFVANNRIKWIKGQRLDLDASLNPAEVTGALSPLARKIRFTFLHPAGASSEFQVNMQVFK